MNQPTSECSCGLWLCPDCRPEFHESDRSYAETVDPSIAKAADLFRAANGAQLPAPRSVIRKPSGLG